MACKKVPQSLSQPINSSSHFEVIPHSAIQSSPPPRTTQMCSFLRSAIFPNTVIQGSAHNLNLSLSVLFWRQLLKSKNKTTKTSPLRPPPHKPKLVRSQIYIYIYMTESFLWLPHYLLRFPCLPQKYPHIAAESSIDVCNDPGQTSLSVKSEMLQIIFSCTGSVAVWV